MDGIQVRTQILYFGRCPARDSNLDRLYCMLSSLSYEYTHKCRNGWYRTVFITVAHPDPYRFELICRIRVRPVVFFKCHKKLRKVITHNYWCRTTFFFKYLFNFHYSWINIRTLEFMTKKFNFVMQFLSSKFRMIRIAS